MIALDSSALAAHLRGDDTSVAATVAMVLAERQACVPPVVLTEILSDLQVPAGIMALIAALPVLETTEGYWQRAGELRSRVIAAGRRARLIRYALISQSCLDHDVSLVTADQNFRHYADVGNLRVLP